MWLIKLIFIIAFFLGFAKNVPAAQANCYTFDLRDTEREIAKVEDRLPISKLDSVEDIALRYRPDPEFRFPYSLDQGAMRYLVLTKGYINLACDIATGIVNAPFGTTQKFLDDLANCITTDNGDDKARFSQCRNKVRSSSDFAIAANAGPAEHILTNNAFLGVVQAAVEHELSHFSNNDFSLSTIDSKALQAAEIRADIASLLGVTNTGSLSIGVGQIFSFVEKVNAYAPSHFVYQSSSCRSKFFAFAAPALVGKLMRIEMFVSLDIDVGKEIVERHSISNPFLDPAELRNSMSECDQRYVETLEQLITDIDLVYSFLDEELKWEKPHTKADGLEAISYIEALLDDVELVDSLVFRLFLLLNSNYGQIASDYNEKYYDTLYSLLSESEFVNRIVVAEALGQIGQGILLRDLDASRVKSILGESRRPITEAVDYFLGQKELLISPAWSSHGVAEAALRASLKFNPNSSEAYFDLARIAAGNGRCQLASTHMKMASEKITDSKTKTDLAWAAGKLLIPDKSEECRRISALIFLVY